MKDDDAPEMPPSKADARRTLSHARARAIQHFRERTVWDAVDEEMFEVVADLKMLREFGDEDGRKFALRELSQLWTRMPPRPVAMPSTAQTKEQWEAQAEAAFEDPAVREFLRRKGCVLPPVGKERN